MRKIDIFLRLINQLLIYPFTDTNSELIRPVQNVSQLKQLSSSRLTKSQESKSRSNLSLSKYNDIKHNLSNLEIVFALSMILKHSHFFSNAVLSIEGINASPRAGYGEFMRSLESSTLDEIRKYKILKNFND